jgi:hypothetical protein
MAENDLAAGGNNEAVPQEPQVSNPLTRVALPGLLILALGITFVWGIVSFFQDAYRARDNYRSFVRPTMIVAPSPNMPIPYMPLPQTFIPHVPQTPVFQPTVPVNLPRSIGTRATTVRGR